MKKKERKKIKMMADSNQWKDEKKEVKINFLNRFLYGNGKNLSAKDKVFVSKTLLKGC